MTSTNNEYLHRQLIRLGDMLGDGDCDPWVGREYRRVATALGVMPRRKRTNNIKFINEAMATTLATTRCPSCNGQLKQTRSGSMRGQCLACNKKYQFKSVKVK